MKISLNKRNKYFFKTTSLTKNKGENILLGGGDGSGRTEILLDLFSSLLKSKNIDSSSIFINFVGDNSLFCKFIAHLNDNGFSDKEDFYLFSALNTHSDNDNDFGLIDFKSEKVKKALINKHILFVTPALEKMKKDYCNDIKNKIFDYIKNLPVNNKKEIPIIIDNISHFSDNDFDEYKILVEEMNKKGYFFVTSTYGMFNYVNVEETFEKLRFFHKHVFMAHSQLNLDNIHMKNIILKEKLNNINCGHFYYFKDFVLQNKRTLFFPHDNNIKLPSIFPEYRSQSEFVEKKGIIKIKD